MQKSDLQYSKTFNTYISNVSKLKSPINICAEILTSGKNESFPYCGKQSDRLPLEMNVNNDKISSIASITKMFTAATFFKCMEDNPKMFPNGINTKINNFSKAKEFLKDDKNINEITIRDLLQHTSGIGNYEEENILKQLKQNDFNKKLTDEQIFQIKTHSTEYGKYSYSNHGYEMLGMIISEIENDKFENVVRKKIIQPLKFENTFMCDEIESKDGKNCIKGHKDKKISSGQYNGRQDIDHLYDTASGGMYSSPSDINKFMEAFFSKDNSFLKEQTTQLLNDKSLLIPNGNEAEPFMGLGYFALDKDNRYRGHGGKGCSVYNYGIYDTEKNKGITVLTTTENKTLKQEQFANKEVTPPLYMEAINLREKEKPFVDKYLDNKTDEYYLQ